jgi:hypothetical protein
MEFVCPVDITSRSVFELFSNNDDNYMEDLTLPFKSILLCTLFQEDALGRQGNYTLVLSFFLCLGALSRYRFIKNQLMLQEIDTKRKNELRTCLVQRKLN